MNLSDHVVVQLLTYPLFQSGVKDFVEAISRYPWKEICHLGGKGAVFDTKV